MSAAGEGDLRERLGRLDDELRVASESGLFVGRPIPQQIVHGIATARIELDAGALSRTAQALMCAELALDSAVRDRGLFWRLRAVLQLPLYLFYLVTLALAARIAISHGDVVVWGAPVWAMSLGCVGANLRGLWFLHFHVSHRSYRAHWHLAHLCAPVVGALLGLLSYLLLMAGLLSIEEAPRATFGNLTLPRVVTLLAGYSWEWVLGVVGRIVGRSKS